MSATGFIYDFKHDDLKEIIENALNEGYAVELTEWWNSWEREQGEPSVKRELKKDQIYNEQGELQLPVSPSREGCAEWNFVNDDELINGFHTEEGDEYICEEAYDAFFPNYKALSK